mmetsp:Transcript_38182/g.99152  ORF Transcript_38182/g.99152 Transcript_38182/m.99152 type:complete len:271 (-) Transcript_38182:35-847(-)
MEAHSDCPNCGRSIEMGVPSLRVVTRYGNMRSCRTPCSSCHATDTSPWLPLSDNRAGSASASAAESSDDSTAAATAAYASRSHAIPSRDASRCSLQKNLTTARLARSRRSSAETSRRCTGASPRRNTAESPPQTGKASSGPGGGRPVSSHTAVSAESQSSRSQHRHAARRARPSTAARCGAVSRSTAMRSHTPSLRSFRKPRRRAPSSSSSPSSSSASSLPSTSCGSSLPPQMSTRRRLFSVGLPSAAPSPNCPGRLHHSPGGGLGAAPK